MTPDKSKPPTPTVDEWRAARRSFSAVSAFLEWCEDQGWELCKRDGETALGANYEPINLHGDRLLAAYEGVDLGQVERERSELLAWQRAQNECR